jgi:hypothetical protein
MKEVKKKGNNITRKTQRVGLQARTNGISNDKELLKR